MSKDTELLISFRCLHGVDRSQVFCYFSIIACLILDYTVFVVKVADRGKLFIITPSLAALSDN